MSGRKKRKKTHEPPAYLFSLSELPSPSQVGMDGLFLMSPDASRTLRKFPLSHIARWATPPSAGGAALVLYTRTPVDVEEVTLTLSGPPPTVRAVLDTLTCCCMQMVELLESEREAGESAASAANGGGGSPSPSSSRHRRHSSGGFRRRRAAPALPAAEDVEFWHSPDKEGWLQSQGDHIKTWRRRWHVLKQGYLFRFASERDAGAGPASRPRGVVDLSKITDVSGGGGAGGAATIRLSTPQGASISYLADSETEAVEWVSALESSVARIVRAVAGFDDQDDDEGDDVGRRSSSSRSARGGNNGGSGRPSRPTAQQQQQNSFDAANSAAAGLAAAGGNPFVSVVGYEGVLGIRRRRGVLPLLRTITSTPALLCAHGARLRQGRRRRAEGALDTTAAAAGRWPEGRSLAAGRHLAASLASPASLLSRLLRPLLLTPVAEGTMPSLIRRPQLLPLLRRRALRSLPAAQQHQQPQELQPRPPRRRCSSSVCRSSSSSVPARALAGPLHLGRPCLLLQLEHERDAVGAAAGREPCLSEFSLK